MKNRKNRLITILIVLAIVFGYRYFFEDNQSNYDASTNNPTESNVIQTTALQTTETLTETSSKNQMVEPSSIAELVEAGYLNEVKKDGEVIGWTSRGDLFYGMGSKHGNRVYHVFAHLKEDPSKPKHSVFTTDEAGLINLLDEAWSSKQDAFTKAQSNGNRVYDIDMDRVIGTEGEEEIRIVVRDGTNQLITAYPRD